MLILSRFILAFGVASLPVAACQFAPGTEQRQERQARDSISKLIPFPDRAQFRGFQMFELPDGTKSYCGEVNQRTPDGNETGFRPYFVTSKETRIAGPAIPEEEMNTAVRKCQASKVLGNKTLTEISCGEAQDILKLNVERTFFNMSWNNNCNPVMIEFVKSMSDGSGNYSSDDFK